jgi:hypothetical protein
MSGVASVRTLWPPRIRLGVDGLVMALVAMVSGQIHRVPHTVRGANRGPV